MAGSVFGGWTLYADASRNVVRIDITIAMVSARTSIFLTEFCRWRKDEAGTVVIHANPPQFQLVLCRLGKKFLQNKLIVGYWAWKMEEIPAIWIQALDYVDAIEVPSAFAQQAIRRHTKRK